VLPFGPQHPGADWVEQKKLEAEIPRAIPKHHHELQQPEELGRVRQYFAHRPGLQIALMLCLPPLVFGVWVVVTGWF